MIKQVKDEKMIPRFHMKALEVQTNALNTDVPLLVLAQLYSA
jgi:hypothetical protein